jgi:hypothetical protein
MGNSNGMPHDEVIAMENPIDLFHRCMTVAVKQLEKERKKINN